MKSINTLIDAYLESKSHAWTTSTLKSERNRLVAVAGALDGNPRTLWKSCSHMKPYSRVTLWTRVIHFWQWCLDRGHLKGGNVYRVFKEEEAAQSFKNAYQPQVPDIAFEEAWTRISTIPHPGIREKAFRLLDGGLRYTEESTLEDGKVRGKGGKVRKVHVSTEQPYDGSYSHFVRVLRRYTGLKPHDLRKIFATRLARSGAQEADLLHVMGWSSMATAKAYLAPLKDEELETKIRKFQGGTYRETKSLSKGVRKTS